MPETPKKFQPAPPPTRMRDARSVRPPAPERNRRSRRWTQIELPAHPPGCRSQVASPSPPPSRGSRLGTWRSARPTRDRNALPTSRWHVPHRASREDARHADSRRVGMPGTSAERGPPALDARALMNRGGQEGIQNSKFRIQNSVRGGGRKIPNSEFRIPNLRAGAG